MLQAGQLGKSDQVFRLPPSADEPHSLTPDFLFVSQHDSNFGLGFGEVKNVTHPTDVHWLVVYSLDAAQPSFKLEQLKRHKFTPEGRYQRIRNSLAALNAEQTIKLTASQWKEIVEEVEDED